MTQEPIGATSGPNHKAKEEAPTPSVGFIGAGKAANVLALALRQAGYPVSAVASRSLASATSLAARVEGCIAYRDPQEVAHSCGVVFITTPDAAISTIASTLSWHPGQWVLHCSGADSTESLSTVAKHGATAGAFHPLQTLALSTPDPAVLRGITFALEAEEPLLDKLKTMAEALGGRWIVLRAEDKALYHASAVMVCNYLITLTAAAADLWSRFGASPQEATSALMPLMKSTLTNLERLGLPDSLTGPIARGDSLTVRRHLEAIRAHAPDLEKAYRELGRLTLPLGRAKGKLDDATIEELGRALAE